MTGSADRFWMDYKASEGQIEWHVNAADSQRNLIGLNLGSDQFEQITRFDKTLWGAELKLHDELFAKLSYHLPTALTDTRAKIEARLAA
jgi:phosphoenolpyruvate carboxykinase (GTP)